MTETIADIVNELRAKTLPQFIEGWHKTVACPECGQRADEYGYFNCDRGYDIRPDPCPAYDPSAYPDEDKDKIWTKAQDPFAKALADRIEAAVKQTV